MDTTTTLYTDKVRPQIVRADRNGQSAKQAVLAAMQRDPQNGYLYYHGPRYVEALRQLTRFHRQGMRVLDIGRSAFTSIATSFLDCPVDTLGFGPDGETETGRHYHYDLNATQYKEAWRQVGPYDIVVFCEVLEHLHTAATLILAYLHFITAPGGKLILQTPNALSLHMRLKTLFGITPYAPLREDVTNPGHIREYTRSEIYGYAAQVGFAVETCLMGAHYDYQYKRHSPTYLEKKRLPGLVNLAYRLMPGRWQPGMTFVLTRP